MNNLTTLDGLTALALAAHINKTDLAVKSTARRVAKRCPALRVHMAMICSARKPREVVWAAVEEYLGQIPA